MKNVKILGLVFVLSGMPLAAYDDDLHQEYFNEVARSLVTFTKNQVEKLQKPLPVILSQPAAQKPQVVEEKEVLVEVQPTIDSAELPQVVQKSDELLNVVIDPREMSSSKTEDLSLGLPENSNAKNITSFVKKNKLPIVAGSALVVAGFWWYRNSR